MSGRRVASILLALVGGLLAMAGTILVVADRSLFHDDEVRATTATIVADRDVKRLLTREITNRVVEVGGLQAVRPQVEDVVTVLLAEPSVEDEVTAGVLEAHRSLIDGTDETIVLNLKDKAAEVRRQAVGVNPALDQTLPPADELLRFDLFQRSELPAVYDVVDTTRAGAWWLLVGGAVLVVVALVLGPGRFSVLATAAATVVAAMFLSVTFLTSAADNRISDIGDPLSRRVARLAVDAYLAKLDDVALGVVIFGMIGVIAGVGGAWIKGALFPTRPGPR